MRRTFIFLIVIFVLANLISACNPIATGLSQTYSIQNVVEMPTNHPMFKGDSAVKDILIKTQGDYTLVIEEVETGEAQALWIHASRPIGFTMVGRIHMGHQTLDGVEFMHPQAFLFTKDQILGQGVTVYMPLTVLGPVPNIISFGEPGDMLLLVNFGKASAYVGVEYDPYLSHEAVK